MRYFARTLIVKTGGMAAVALLLLSLGTVSPGQKLPSKLDIERGRVILQRIKDDLKKNYYDPNFHGMDVEARFKTADDKIKQAESLGQIFGIVAQVLLDLDDSHTFFLPPQRRDRTDYGWQMQMIGNRCYVVAVKPGSDAEKMGLKPGDEIKSMDGRVLTRDSLSLWQYYYYSLRPQPGMRLVVARPSGEQRQVDVMARITVGKQVTDLTEGHDMWDLIRESESEDRLHRQRYIEAGDLFIWKMPQFDLPRNRVDDLMDKIKKRKNLILDLRGNGGGNEETLLRLIANLFDHDIKLGDLKRRKETIPLIAKSRGKEAYAGNLMVLVDSNSGSAAELLARVVQIEKRGMVIGDQTSGAVMRARQYEHELGTDVVIFYDVSITDADIIMSDGKSLEHIGVIPNEILLPTAADLATSCDPVMARAAALLGITIDPAKAGSLFPLEWRK